MPADDLPVAEFGFPGPLRDQLVAAILSGEKTTTSGLVADYEHENEPLPDPGLRQVVVDSAGANPLWRRPRRDAQQRRLGVRRGEAARGNAGKKQASSRPFADRPGGTRPPGDLRLTRPLGLFPLLRVKRRTVQGEPRIPPQ